ncbi:MAG: UDP-N-acetylmuramate dehydrogenase [Rhodobacteraceae bacterium]|nr:UDP-N-acetylmuramate dehydrogenase [Paracoccaceae bacterium]MCY4197596.1 UDP-N-acetylmuramate dehydrogenase [Paracoccaceae bacterium]MCY4327615.1 UDP-N-acetylmuramate dehydrogenase [Paracoccaceae bacterium]
MDESSLPTCRGVLTAQKSLADLTWLRVGGPAEWFFQPADCDDLRGFLAALPPEVPTFVIGVGSNLIVRDGGIKGVVIRLGRAFTKIEISPHAVRAGAAVLASRLACRAAESGLDLAFLRTIPGTIGGAVRMNAGCYGTYVADVCREVTFITRCGAVRKLSSAELGFSYRSSELPEGAVIVEAVFGPRRHAVEKLQEQMESQLRARDMTQPANCYTAGSVFRNPAGFSSTGKEGDPQDFKAWKLIDQAGARGLRQGQAIMSDQHANFMVNLGGATAADLELLGETVRQKVLDNSGIRLEWEIMRVGI